jgi:tRNA A-37 threonylcarbamoyl transferase component Bud32
MSVTHIGRYEVEKELGHGAMAVVYKAVDPVIGRVVAIKTIRMEQGMGLEQEELRQRLYREAQSAGNLNHPNIVTIYDIGEEGDLSYIAMEFIEGESLENWMTRNRIPPVEQTVAIIEQVASGLDYAGARGIIHRDIKPGNILLTADGRAKIADFGIAKFSTSKFTQTGMIMGTPAYMSPEQALGHTIDGRSDIFSLGVIFYEMLTGERPFSGANSTTIIYKIVHEDVVPASKLNINLPSGIDYIVQKMLAKNPDERYQSCAEVVQDLRNYTSLKASAKRKAAPAAAPAQAAGGPRYALIAVIAIAVIVVGVLGYLLLQENKQRLASGSAQPAAAPAVQEPVASAAKAARKRAKPSSQAVVPAAAPEEAVPRPAKEKPVPEKPAFAQVRIDYGSATYPVSIFDGDRRLDDVVASGKSLQIAAGEHRFRAVSEDVFLDNAPDKAKVKANEVYVITLPGLGSAYIEVPNDAYDGCSILLDGKKLPTPYPAQIQRLAAGEHKVTFSWSSGKYSGREFNSQFTTQENHLYRVRGEPQSDRVTVQQVR